MTMAEPPTTATGFVHHACVYGSDQAFVNMAMPFVQQGLERGEPVLVTTTPANFHLLAEALGPDAGRIDYAETAYFGRRPPQRIAAFTRYWQRNRPAAADGQVRILAEPVWSGKSAQDVRAWTRMESTLNAVLAPANIFMICPYDTRVVEPGIVTDAQRTHPHRIDGREVQPSGTYADPAVFTSALDTTALPEPPAEVPVSVVEGDLRRIRHLVATQAAGYGLAGERLRLLVLAVNETAEYLARQGSGAGSLRSWMQAGAVVVEVSQPGAQIADPYLGFRPPALGAVEQAGLWLARQVCDHVDIRPTQDGVRVRLTVPGPRAEELLQTPTPYTT